MLHPDVEHIIDTDIDILRLWVRTLLFVPVIGKYVHWLSLEDAVEDFNVLLTKQIDLTIEARNLDTFQEHFERNPKVMVPVPFWEFTTPSVLCETFIEGTPIREFVGTPHAAELAEPAEPRRRGAERERVQPAQRHVQLGQRRRL